MRRINITLGIAVMTLALFTFGCKKDEVQPQAKVNFGMTTSNAVATSEFASARPTTVPNEEHPTLNWDIAWMMVSDITFDAEYNDFSGTSGNNMSVPMHYEWHGYEQVNLLGDPRFFGSIELKPGMYEKIQLSMVSRKQNDTEEPNFYLEGMYGPEIGGTPIFVYVNQDFTLESEISNYVINTSNQMIFNSLINLSLEDIFNGITSGMLDQATLNNGTIIISSTQNTDLYDRILDNLRVNPATEIVWGTANSINQ